jgi:hypothetical protein
MKTNKKPTEQPKVNLTEALRQGIQREIDRLSETLDKIEPTQRLNIVCKILPFVVPKIESEPLIEENEHALPKVEIVLSPSKEVLEQMKSNGQFPKLKP